MVIVILHWSETIKNFSTSVLYAAILPILVMLYVFYQERFVDHEVSLSFPLYKSRRLKTQGTKISNGAGSTRHDNYIFLLA